MTGRSASSTVRQVRADETRSALRRNSTQVDRESAGIREPVGSHHNRLAGLFAPSPTPVGVLSFPRNLSYLAGHVWCPRVKIPRSFGRYQVVDLIGQGGMGALYRARDPLIGRYVAIKWLQRTTTPTRSATVSREARPPAA